MRPGRANRLSGRPSAWPKRANQLLSLPLFHCSSYGIEIAIRDRESTLQKPEEEMRSKTIWLAWMVMLLLSCVVSNPADAVDLNNVRPTQDTYIQQNTANSSYGGNGYVWLGDMGNASCTNCLGSMLLQYDIASIPRNATVNTVTLSFQRSASVGAGVINISLRLPTSAWNESNATWNLVGLSGVIGTATLDTNR